MEKRTTDHKIFKIAITGPESTGKSTLTEQLANHYNTVWVPEFARDYIASLDRNYELNDILVIAKSQIKKEEEMLLLANRFLFCDTELIVTKIWSEHSFNTCDKWILENINKNRYDLYLLCDIDLPWEFDPLREHPHLREYFFNLYLKELRSRNFHYAIISGNNQMRLQNALNTIENFFTKTI
jgi:NadR type nicotinamide-nucleotide adenylyltransferase